jgi:hypothetical protein
MIAATVLSLAIVAQDPSALRVAPTDTATIEATLYQGEALEVRGQKGEFLQVYDHRLERAGYIRAWQVRTVTDRPEDAPALLSVVRFLHDAPGEESLGIAYAAAYLKAAKRLKRSVPSLNAWRVWLRRASLQQAIRRSPLTLK